MASITIYSNFNSVNYGYKKSIDTRRVESLIAREDYATIIKSKELFQQVFYMSASESKETEAEESQHTEHQPLHFKVNYHLTKSMLYVTGQSDCVERINESIEKLRHFFKISYSQKKPSSFQIVRVLDTTRWCILYLRQTAEIDYRVNPECIIDSRANAYERVFQPSIRLLSELLGARFSSSEEKLIWRLCPPAVELTEVMRIEWKSITRLTYPFPILKVKVPSNDKTPYFEKWQQRLHCDVKLKYKTDSTIAKTDNTISAHKLFLSIHGGECIRKMLESDMKEGREHIIEFTDFHKPVI